ncbi:hypothetical protein VNO77_27929 [Canavalia gladiata]|uniref:Uncharacterized protein n=1 Tax=Canavalia gladiata TaxID=3824 RepID=A0AAN9QAY8_CANGL
MSFAVMGSAQVRYFWVKALKLFPSLQRAETDIRLLYTLLHQTVEQIISNSDPQHWHPQYQHNDKGIVTYLQCYNIVGKKYNVFSTGTWNAFGVS